MLASLLGLACSVLVFLKLADSVREVGSLSWDDRVLLLFRREGSPDVPIGPAWLPGAVRDISAMGGPVVMSIVAGGVFGYLLILGYRRNAWRLAVAALGGVAVVSLLKHAFARPRPSIVSHLMDVSSTSFPSGHSMMSAVVYLTLGVMVARVTRGVRGRVYVVVLFILVATMVGLSRLYLGVHYPTDVLGGWAAGLAWALACSLVIQRWPSKRTAPRASP